MTLAPVSALVVPMSTSASLPISASPLALSRAVPRCMLVEVASSYQDAAVALGTTNNLALFGWPSYSSAGSAGLGGHEGDLALLFGLVVLFPTVVTVLLTNNSDD
eukprot:CAMPEP_0119360550 /NCGR_PEP_ID=MMETSP1334-20130426/8115_1 /TAXON_ID=127549 /ORGANISM="Calcidiscus leptoporus, Strain RCC1130" /LENGTH=104 /DNA_ID=CAMNT_0007375397 /DNA_START=30 /DNA_END=344 /DNA_ORIENTATION=+